MMRWNIAILIMVVTLTCTDVEAQWRRRWRRATPRPSPQRTQASTTTQLPPRLPYPGPPWQRATDDYYRAAYPKYYGGFHSRELQNLGFPSSDIGLRGNGLFMGPW